MTCSSQLSHPPAVPWHLTPTAVDEEVAKAQQPYAGQADRWQIVAVSVGVSILAAWRLEGFADLAWPALALAITFGVGLGFAAGMISGATGTCKASWKRAPIPSTTSSMWAAG